MDELEEEIKTLLANKMATGEELNITDRDLINIQYYWTDDDSPALDEQLTKKLSERTLKEIFALFPR